MKHKSLTDTFIWLWTLSNTKPIFLLAGDYFLNPRIDFVSHPESFSSFPSSCTLSGPTTRFESTMMFAKPFLRFRHPPRLCEQNWRVRNHIWVCSGSSPWMVKTKKQLKWWSKLETNWCWTKNGKWEQ